MQRWLTQLGESDMLFAKGLAYNCRLVMKLCKTPVGAASGCASRRATVCRDKDSKAGTVAQLSTGPGLALLEVCLGEGARMI